MTDTLLELLGAVPGALVCFVGAGGKKSSLYQLARVFDGRVGITATAHIEPFPRRYAQDAVVTDAPDLVDRVCAAAEHSRVVAFAKPCPNPGRLLGVTHDELAAIRARAGFDLLLVKADGARGRIVKAPAEHEPAVPPDATTVVPVLSVRALGQPLSERIAHRPERIAALCGIAPGTTLEPTHLAQLLASPQGALQGSAGKRVVPVVNMVDDDGLAALARDIAREALARTDRFDRVVLAAMNRPQPLVDVVTR